MTHLTDEILVMAKKRTPPKQIASTLRIHPNTVYQAIRDARRRGHDIPQFKTTRKPKAVDVVLPTKQIVLPLRLHSLLAAEAERRGQTPTEAAQRLLEAALLGTVVKS
ncbi:helix-turn-helix domain-containing protein [Sulfitobacter pseudonitzschiae]|uniref:Helix-turn-helix domain-containing protein n=1 Tax=Pseudosulfitobacter pseudonitzschiae TaxID=1402135 RepID=A0A9Q2NSC4_9RHOB|nr:helix-turn-helix domain-containing protein [Pseudosulfitobacter pseudonitzschiae]MBM2294674.1 helix-turn-helix domain-containing protein [Pseudosulfitobacter pseudonitzschiae]MBM2299611.1 helix-turn-helix domain-containing protein [Pseudosulfitobacter pseudonitzschiae]MBM2304552.1 helix-turn-helix domain-containing protein [Pseudosulfitobacter pseudonitzschiae]MBM2314285.1 helix-turn-helix domain-containing protein [Pseudosulfitobacter pseudonitzschiae]MBM2319243.1 helix-turn-helix domain-c